MGFQKTVNLMPCAGLPGGEVVKGQAVYAADNYVSDGTLEVGQFAFVAAADGEGEKFGFAGKTGTKLIGFVERNLIGNLRNVFVEASDVLQQGAAGNIAGRGAVYMLATGAATEGQAVLCDPATGEVTYGVKGAANDTGWKVHLPAGVAEVEEGDLIIVENWTAA